MPPSTTDLKDVDLYGLLGVDRHATEKQVISAYRKAALKCHPDKNPDNPAAVERFQELSKALAILTDPAARAAYDKVLDGKVAAALRHRELDSKRKKFKEDLEAREKAAAEKGATTTTSLFRKTERLDISAAEALKRQLDRLREEGSALLKAEQERLRQLLREDLQLNPNPSPNHIPAPNRTTAPNPAESQAYDLNSSYKLRLKWRCSKDDKQNGGYSSDLLESLCKKYGEVSALLVTSKKKGTAVVEFTTYSAALSAIQSESGLAENPLVVSWLTPPVIVEPTAAAANDPHSTRSTEFSGAPPPPAEQSRVSASHDFESVVLMRLRQAEERKRLAQELEQED